MLHQLMSCGIRNLFFIVNAAAMDDLTMNIAVTTYHESYHNKSRSRGLCLCMKTPATSYIIQGLYSKIHTWIKCHFSTS